MPCAVGSTDLVNYEVRNRSRSLHERERSLVCLELGDIGAIFQFQILAVLAAELLS